MEDKGFVGRGMRESEREAVIYPDPFQPIMFCIVRCDRCGALQGAVHPISSSRCRACGRTINVLKNPPIGTFEKESDMRKVLQERMSQKNISRSMDEPNPILEPDNVKRPISLKNREERVRYIMEMIGCDMITYIELKRSCLDRGIDEMEFELIMKHLFDQNIVFEPKNGHIARV